MHIRNYFEILKIYYIDISCIYDKIKSCGYKVYVVFEACVWHFALQGHHQTYWRVDILTSIYYIVSCLYYKCKDRYVGNQNTLWMYPLSCFVL